MLFFLFKNVIIYLRKQNSSDKINKINGILFIPYLIWVSFVSILNFTVWMLN
ncbi:hypothetical protein D4R86_01585 [bacterium]|nr:MAG: hypothetical protein D4R86_01585 [bacterium]